MQQWRVLLCDNFCYFSDTTLSPSSTVMPQSDYKQTELFGVKPRKGPVLGLLEECTSEVGYHKLKGLAEWLDYLIAEQRKKDEMRREYFELRRTGYKTKRCVQMMVEKYGVSEDNLNQIIYPRI